MKALLAGIIVSLAIGASGALAQATSSGQGSTSPDKQAISKSCSDQANAKGLRGKARKRFRSECKRAARKSS